jgi:hypothetical protein
MLQQSTLTFSSWVPVFHNVNHHNTIHQPSPLHHTVLVLNALCLAVGRHLPATVTWTYTTTAHGEQEEAAVT